MKTIYGDQKWSLRICGGNKLSPFNFLPKGIWWRELCGQVQRSLPWRQLSPFGDLYAMSAKIKLQVTSRSANKHIF